MGELCAFPGSGAREAIKEIMRAYAECRIDRARFDRDILQVLDVYGVSRLCVDDFVVKAIPVIEGVFRTVLTQGNKRSDACPGCGNREYRYLVTVQEAASVGYDAITVVCPKCGTIYEKLARNELTQNV